MPRNWTPNEDALLGTTIDRKVAARLGCTIMQVTNRRIALGVPAFKKNSRDWSPAELALLGTMSDSALAAKLDCSRKHVSEVRQRHGVAPFSAKNVPRKVRRKLAARRRRKQSPSLAKE